ncbi:MAG: histidine--tRNA ligase [Candidatus Sungbacteria bacterium]|nr:histidine--tRNA ligase [Candidatus Sungbacteria bacterium]
MKLNNKNQSRIKPELPSGFREYGPREAIAKQGILDAARKTFESFGFDPIETPAVERTEILTGGEEDAQKIIYNVSPSTSSGRKGRMSESLRFDLTVPLARFVAANPEIPKPFKRYQIGQVWRGESPQAGRYREFTQADVDIVGSASIEADAEIIAVIYWTLKSLGIDEFKIKMSNRKIMNQLPAYAGFPKSKLPRVLRTLDKKDKIGVSGLQMLIKKEFGESAAKKIEEFVTSIIPNDLVLEGKDELLEVIDVASDMGVEKSKLEVDFSIVRGLTYYTGMVFETFLSKISEIGSIFSGGRYDNLLIPFTGEKIPAVGASLGVDRLLAALEKLGKLPQKQTNTRVLIFSIDDSLKNEYLEMARELRQAGVNTSVYLGTDRAFQAQLAYAVKKEIPYVVIYGADEKKKGVVAVKNLETREQKEVPKEKITEIIRRS